MGWVAGAHTFLMLSCLSGQWQLTAALCMVPVAQAHKALGKSQVPGHLSTSCRRVSDAWPGGVLGETVAE